MLRILALLTALLAPITADAASRFWVGGTGTWDASDTTHWASSSGGAGGASVPGASDSAIFDGSSGGGTVTVSHASNTIQSLTMSAFTGTLDFATNDNNITLTAASAFTSNGSGTRTLNMGDGTWTISSATGSWTTNGATNFTLNANGSTILFSATSPTGRAFFYRATESYNVVSFAEPTASAYNRFQGGNVTVATLSLGAGTSLLVDSGATLTITNAMTWTGTASKPISLASNNVATSFTISSANNLTCQYCAFARATFSGGGTATATNSFNLGNNSGITITPPSAGGAHVVGG